MAVSNDELSDREREILCLVATGASNKEIAQQLYISTNTVKVHLRNIFVKIEVNSRTEAAMYAVSAGLVPGLSQTREEEGNPPDVLVDLGFDRGTSPGGTVESTIGRRIKPGWIGLVVVLVVSSISAAYFIMGAFRGSEISKNAISTSSSSWHVLTPMSVPRFGFAAVVHNNSIYAIAGESEEGISNIVDRYDPEENRWVHLAEKPTPVTDVQGVVVGGKIYIPGGRTLAGPTTNILEIYDPQTDTWEQGSVLPNSTSSYALAAYEGKLYLFGGWDGEKYLSTIYEYDPEEDSWYSMSTLSTQRADASAVVVGGKIHLLGGYDGRRALSMHEIYYPNLDDGENNPWSEGVPLPEPRYKMEAVSIADNIYLVGGNNDGPKTLPPLGLITLNQEWQVFPNPVAQTWTDLGAVAIWTNIYVFGGNIAQEPVDKSLFYQAIYLTVLPIVP